MTKLIPVRLAVLPLLTGCTGQPNEAAGDSTTAKAAYTQISQG